MRYLEGTKELFRRQEVLHVGYNALVEAQEVCGSCRWIG